MRGEHCIAGASVFTFISILLLVFTHIGQINPTTLPRGIYMVQVNVAAYGAGLQGATNVSVGGLYDSKNDPLGTAKGLRQYYRWNFYGACGYQKDGSGICNGTTFGYPFEPLAAVLGDTPSKFYTQTSDIIPASQFKNNSSNGALSRAAFWVIFIGSVATLIAFISGLIRSRIFFLLAMVASAVGSLCLLIGAAIWTSLITKNNFVNIVKVQHGASLGINVSPGPALYLTWVAFAFVTLAVLPYTASCMTYRRAPKVNEDDTYNLLPRKNRY